MKKKLLTLVLALCVFSLPLWAIVSGRTLTNTLKDLYVELLAVYEQRAEAQQRFDEEYRWQHQRIVDVIKESNELSILLYTQEQEMTFDLAYALKKVTARYNDFSNDRRSYDRIVEKQNYEIDRYARLIEALDTLATPFVLDKSGQAFRDSCIHLASELLKMNADNRAKVIADSTHYQKAYLRIKETRDYAEKRYRDLERYVFIDGQTPFLDMMANHKLYWSKAKADFYAQYSLNDLFKGMDEATEEELKSKDNKEAFTHLSSKGENALLLILCILQLFFLTLTWLAFYIILHLLCHYTRLKKYIPKKKRAIISILIGTIAYFVIFAFDWGGDEYMQLGVRHVNTFLWLLIAITGSLLLRVKPEQFREGFLLYSATFMIVLVIIACRISFIPDKLMVILFPPILLVATIWQLFFCIREHSKVMTIDRTLGWVSLTIYLGAFVCSFLGYTFVALLILVWWYFLLAVWLTVVCITFLLSRYKERWLDKRVKAMRNRITYVTGEDRESLLLGATWFYDLIRQVAIPAIVLLSLPLCVSLSLGIFDFDDLYVRFYENPFIQLYDKSGTVTLRISMESIINLLILYYVLRYLSRAIHAIWQYGRYIAFMRKHNRTTIRVNEINLSLGNSIISALVWLSYAMIVVYVWKIPTGSLGLIAGGLSAGIGLALKDTINNFIYGIQLMGGRLRVGDWIECDGVRGKVVAINYQCVQIETIEGTEMSFLNSSLFGKNFNNLTRNNSYELTIITVRIAYGTAVQQVRDVLVKAMQKMRTKDHYGREIVDPKYAFNVVVGNMSESSVDINVKQYVLVAERIAYVDRAKEVIYEALTAAGITIAFPQCDVHLITPPSELPTDSSVTPMTLPSEAE